MNPHDSPYKEGVTNILILQVRRQSQESGVSQGDRGWWYEDSCALPLLRGASVIHLGE